MPSHVFIAGEAGVEKTHLIIVLLLQMIQSTPTHKL